jgi:rhodanese-related sulfurtransferase
MSKKYLLPLILFLGFGIVLLILPSNKQHDQITPEALLSQINSPSRFISPDQVADRLIKKDPSMVLVDVRTVENYRNFTLPGAVSIPLGNLNDPGNLELFDQDGIDFILFSNGTIISDQAWILGKRLGIKNLYVMQGGINLWFDNFFKTPVPTDFQAESELELYQFRLGVRQFFTGGNPDQPKPDQAETIQVQQKVKKTAAEGGC